MKKLLLTIVAVMLCASTISAAPATAGGGATAKKTATKKTTTKKTTAKKATSTKKATTAKTTAKKTTTAKKQAATKTASAAATKAEQRQEERQEQYGLMPSELDNLNHNVFHADAAAIRGALDTESALRYLPFVTIVNTAGFGSQFDLRGQGRLSANGVKLYINGIPANPVDSYYKAMPINMILPSLIQEVAITPGGGAVNYGSGTKGGTINIITSKRQAPYFLVGGGYVNTMATEGHSFNAFASAAENLGAHLRINAGLAFSQMGGPREGDSTWLGQAVVGAWYDIGWGQSVSIDADFSMGKTKTTPYNSLVDYNEIVKIMEDGETTQNSQNTVQFDKQQAILSLPNSTPSKGDRATKGMGEIETTQMRATAKLGYENQLTQKLKLNVDAFYTMDNKKYDKYIINLPYFVLGNYEPGGRGAYWDMMMPRPNPSTRTDDPLLYNEQRGDFHLLDQSGSTFNDNKFGAMGKVNWKHSGGEFNFGLNFMYEMANRHTLDYLRKSMAVGSMQTGFQNLYHPQYSNIGFEANVESQNKFNTMTTAVFVSEHYNFNRFFSITGGMRYELKNYDVSYEDKFRGQKLQVYSTNDFSDVRPLYDVGEGRVVFGEPKFNQNFDNFTFELVPALRYSNTGAVYLSGEMGYIAPPAWAMIQRIGQLANWQGGYAGAPEYHFGYRPTELENETYWTAELGWKEMIGTRRIPLGFTNFNINAMLFSANIFYTDSQNEFYFEGDTWSGMTFGNYDKSRRMGAEVAFEQYLLGGVLGLNESFTYIKAEYKTEEGWRTIPYTYDYKATLGANVNVAAFIEVIDLSINVWMQNSIYGNQTIYTRNMEPYWNNGTIAYRFAETTTSKLKPYLISDFGVSVGLNKNMGIVTVGIKNLFDTLYYDYFNNDRASVVNENRYVAGRGRTVFVEGRYRY